MDAVLKLKEYKEKVEKELGLFFDKKLLEVSGLDSHSYEMIELIREYTLRGGKRIRAAFFFYGYKLFSNDDSLDMEIIRASMCFELIQSYLLIHDDFMDRDDLRRGGSTLHKSYELLHLKDGLGQDAEHFGASMAILAGDLCVHFANEIICDINISSDFKINAIKELNRMIPLVIYGQLLDIRSDVVDCVSRDDIMKIHMLKTATYTIEAPLGIGAILAGVSFNKLGSLSKYAIPLGQAFQIQDDILGLYGDEKKLGKPIGSDLIEGKKTLLILDALSLCNDSEKKKINLSLGNPKLSLSDIDEVRSIIRNTGALGLSQKLASKLINESRLQLNSLNIDNDARTFLDGIAGYMLNREY